MKKTIIVTGANGFLGSWLIERLRGSDINIIGLVRKQLKPNDHHVFYVESDLFNQDKIVRIIEENNSKAVVHLAAKTHIDACENDRSKGRDSEAWKVNVETTKNMAYASRKLGVYMIYLSTECVFDGVAGFYKEDSEPNPINWYGETKYFGEQEVLKEDGQYAILRSVMAFGHKNRFSTDIARTFYDSVSRGEKLRGVVDQKISFTFIDDLADIIFFFINKHPNGIYHFCGTPLTPYEFAKYFLHEFNFNNVEIIPTRLYDYFGEKARLRLKKATLNCEKINKQFQKRPSGYSKIFSILKKRFHE